MEFIAFCKGKHTSEFVGIGRICRRNFIKNSSCFNLHRVSRESGQVCCLFSPIPQVLETSIILAKINSIAIKMTIIIIIIVVKS